MRAFVFFIVFSLLIGCANQRPPGRLYEIYDVKTVYEGDCIGFFIDSDQRPIPVLVYDEAVFKLSESDQVILFVEEDMQYVGRGLVGGLTGVYPIKNKSMVFCSDFEGNIELLSNKGVIWRYVPPLQE